MEHGGGTDAEIHSPVYRARGRMVDNAPTGPRTTRVAEILPLMWQRCNGNTRSPCHRYSQQGDHQLEASWMPSIGHHAGEVHRQPEIGNDLAGLPAQLHGGTDPCSKGTSITGRVVSFFEPGQVRGPDSQRSGGSDGGVIVGSSPEFSDASLDKSWRYMDRATAPRAERHIAESDVGRGDHGRGDSGAPEEETTTKAQWKTLARHRRCSSSVVSHVAEREASGSADASDSGHHAGTKGSKHLTTTSGEQLRFRRPVGSLEASGGPPGCIGGSPAKDPTKGFGSFGVESARDATKGTGGTA